MAKVLITGSNGQVGTALQQQWQGKATLLTLTREELDITDRDAVLARVHAFQPDIIINAAAYTAVDKAESDMAPAQAVNIDGVRYLAEAAKAENAAFLHLSTDYVFDGTKIGEYTEDDSVSPQSVYGRSKLAGEQAALHHHDKTLVLRTSWVFGEHGHNFVKTMLRLAKTRDTLSVVNDQLGGPTYAGDIAAALITISEQIIRGTTVDYGIYHYSGRPYVSWYEFARTIFAEAVAQGILPQAPQLHPITTDGYPTPAKRPANSCLNLDKIQRAFNIAPSDWQQALKALHLYT